MRQKYRGAWQAELPPATFFECIDREFIDTRAAALQVAEQKQQSTAIGNNATGLTHGACYNYVYIYIYIYMYACMFG